MPARRYRLPHDRQLHLHFAHQHLGRDYRTPIAMIAPDFMRGIEDSAPCLTLTNPGFDLMISERLADDVASPGQGAERTK